MNDQLRSILHNAWNEPRHFFFWLAMLSIGGLAAVAVGFVAVNTSLPGPMLLLGFVTLGSMVCFAVSVPAFILAWIPPVRRLFAWLLGRKVLALGCLATLVALFYAVEDWRGRRAWQDYKRAREAEGEWFDLVSKAPPPVPDDQNFFETPLFNDMHYVQTNGVTVWRDTNWWHHVIFDAFGPEPEGNKAPSTGSWIKAQRVDLAAWQAFYRGSNNWFAAQSGPRTNYFPIAKEAQTPAADVLLALGRFEGNRQLLIAAAARPQARFWINYEGGFSALLPHLARLKRSSPYLALHANAALKAGDRETALEDMKLLFRLMETVRSEPIVISHLVRIAMLQIALQPVWEGLADRQWTDADLRVIESELGKLDFLADYDLAMRNEQAAHVWLMDYVRKKRAAGLNEIFSLGGPAPAPVGQFLSKATFSLVPAGWFDQNKLSLCRINEKYLLPLVDRGRRVVPPAAVRESESIIEAQDWRPYDIFSRLLLRDLLWRMLPGGLPVVAEKCAVGQACADLARVGCALERYRLANGQFPETLEALGPKFIEKLPHDVINGQPLKYRRTDDGQFVLYSVGWNETDDGGTVGLMKEGAPGWKREGGVDWRQGDWVWRYPAR
jgi:hypothetical protein